MSNPSGRGIEEEKYPSKIQSAEGGSGKQQTTTEFSFEHQNENYDIFRALTTVNERRLLFEKDPSKVPKYLDPEIEKHFTVKQ
jgi:hypothetical protein